MPPDDARRETLRHLIDLAEGSNPGDCWDDVRAEELLRRQSNASEMRELGMSERLIERVFGDADARPRAGEFVVRVEARFEAAHFLREYRGISEPLHGHSYKVEAELAARGGGVDGDAIAVDFKPEHPDRYCIRCEGFAECSARHLRLNRAAAAAPPGDDLAMAP